jgi:glycosyltransferase involved in cell wall biosynthesis
LKALYLSATGALGGAERSLLDLLESIRQARPGWELELLTLGEGDLNRAALRLGFATHTQTIPRAAGRIGDAGAGGPAGHRVSKLQLAGGICWSAPQLGPYIWKLRRFIRAQTPDVIHSNGFKTHLLAAWTAPSKTALIWHVRDYVSSRPLMSHLMRVHARRCTVAIANSDSVAKDLNDVCRHKLEIRTVYNALDLRRFNPEGPKLDVDAASGLPDCPHDSLRVGLIATMARWKGHEVFLRAISMMSDKNLRAYIIGGPIYSTNGSEYSLAELRVLARALGVEQRVGFTGFVSDPAAAIRALDIVVHASTRSEPFGRVVAEAMACGKPVVVSRSGGVTEIIRDNENALSHPPGDAAMMAACIERLRADAGLRRQMGVRARSWAEQKFDRARLATDVTPIYQLIVDQGSRRFPVRSASSNDPGTLVSSSALDKAPEQSATHAVQR